MSLSRINMVGAFPPPTHGMAAVNAAVRDRLLASGAELQVIDVAAPGLNRGVLHRLGRLPRILSGLWRVLVARTREDAVLYMSVSGGFGQIYELVFLALARVKGMRLVMHHHSFAYLDRPNRLTAGLMRLAGEESTQVVLSRGMGERLVDCYGVSCEILAMSNAALLLDGEAERQPMTTRDGLCVVGFLSNISAEKGVFEFLDVVQAAAEQGLVLKARLAGPFQDMDTECRVRERLQTLPQVEYLGPVYGEDKQNFYRSIDVLLFPTRYRNEAEPLVVLEAMQNGLPVIAFGRGSIPEIIDNTCGHLVAVDENFTMEALQCLRRWLEVPASLGEIGQSAKQRFQSVRSCGLAALRVLEEILLHDIDHARPYVKDKRVADKE